jgi:hypothetical protein
LSPLSGVCCVGSGLTNGHIIRSGGVVSSVVCLKVCGLETSTMSRRGPDLGCYATERSEING